MFAGSGSFRSNMSAALACFCSEQFEHIMRGYRADNRTKNRQRNLPKQLLSGFVQPMRSLFHNMCPVVNVMVHLATSTYGLAGCWFEQDRIVGRIKMKSLMTLLL